MKKQMKDFKKDFLKKLIKVVGALFIILVLFGVYNSIFLGGSKSINRAGSNDILKKSLSPLSAPGLSMREESIDMTQASDMEYESKSEGMIGDGNYIPTESVTDKKVIKNGFLTLKVDSTDTAKDEISGIVTGNEGEVFSSNFNEYRRGSKSGQITVKVPVDKFQKVVNEIKLVATQVISESTSGMDVTERYVDLNAQLKNKRAEEATFVGLLDRSGKLDDVLMVSKEIARVRGQIERLEGKIKYLESQTSMSTITINISEDAEITPIANDWRPAQVVKESLNDLKKQAQDFVDGSIHFVIVAIPSLIPFVIFLFIVYLIGKKLYRSVIKK